MDARGRVLQELDRHQEALPALQDALHFLPADEPGHDATCARLHFALAQSAIACHLPQLLRESLRLARLHGQVCVCGGGRQLAGWGCTCGPP